MLVGMRHVELKQKKKVSKGRLYTWKIQYKLLYKDAAAYVKG
jgi:hypothetical protein